MSDGELWRQLAALGQVRTFRRGQPLVHWSGSGHDGLVAVVRGLCKVVNSTGGGRESLVTVRGPGDVIGELSALTGRGRTASVVALAPVEASLIARSAFDAWLDGAPASGRLLATMLAERVIETTSPLTGAHSMVETRLADRVLYLHDRFATDGAGSPAPDEIRVALTHDDYAAWVGASRAVTSRAFASLRDRGLIDFGRGWVRVTDRDGLAALCFES